MIDSIKRLILFRIKSLEFKYRTWKNNREITHAYEGEKPSVPKRLPKIDVRKAVKVHKAFNIRKMASVFAIILLVCLTGYGLYTVGNYVKDVRFEVPSMKKILVESSEEQKDTSLAYSAGRQSKDNEPRAVEKEMEPQKDSFPEPLNRQAVLLDTTPELVMITEQKPASSADNTFEFEDSMDYMILANKADKQIHLLKRGDSHWSTLFSFRMAIGANVGPKEVDGDQRTPEGLYFIVGRKEGRELNEIYGPLAYVLNYPNAEDRRKGRTGQGIWIHGTAPDSSPVQTRGCLELDNGNVEKLSTILQIGIGTPVYIVDQQDLDNPAEYPSYDKIALRRQKILEQYNRNQNYFAQVVIDWQKAWESQQISSYEKFYHHEKFFGQGLAWQGWRERKIRTFIAYDTIRVNCNDILLTDFSESTAVVKFIQRYESDVLQVEGGKKLSLIKGGDGWKIIGESTFPKEELLL